MRHGSAPAGLRTDPVVLVQDLVAVAGRFPLLTGIDLEVRQGEIVALMGANGSGKTSLLRALGGLVEISRGTGSIAGRSLGRSGSVSSALPSNGSGQHGAPRPQGGHNRNRDAGVNSYYVGHNEGLIGALTVIENLRFWSHGFASGDDEIEAALARLEVPTRLRDVSASKLSAGQRRRVGLAVAVLRRPLLWLLDEPHASLDPEGSAIVDRLLSAAASAGAAVVFSSHDPGRAASVATRVLTMADGAIAMEARHDEITRQDR